MSDLTNLMKAIIVSPSDDLPRLVLADWLEENGQAERAEFIRTQIELPHAVERLEIARDCNADHLHFQQRVIRLRQRELKLVNSKPARAGWFERFGGTWQVFTGTEIDGGMGQTSPDVFVVRRGFVAEVRCTLADWCGGECEACGGETGYEYDSHLTGEVVDCPCRHCSGTGRTPGIGPATVAAHPVERVVLTDRAPLLAPGLGRRAWLADDAMMGQVPDNCRVGLLFRWLPKTPGYAANLRVYESAELALDALSAAALEWARAEAAG